MTLHECGRELDDSRAVIGAFRPGTCRGRAVKRWGGVTKSRGDGVRWLTRQASGTSCRHRTRPAAREQVRQHFIRHLHTFGQSHVNAHLITIVVFHLRRLTAPAPLFPPTQSRSTLSQCACAHRLTLRRRQNLGFCPLFQNPSSSVLRKSRAPASPDVSALPQTHPSNATSYSSRNDSLPKLAACLVTRLAICPFQHTCYKHHEALTGVRTRLYDTPYPVPTRQTSFPSCSAISQRHSHVHLLQLSETITSQ